MSLRAVEQLTRAGLAPAFNAADVAGDAFPNDGRTMARWKNTSGAPITVTIAIPQGVDGQTTPGKVVTVPATTGDMTTDVFPPEYNNSLGQVTCTYSGVTNLSIAVFRHSRVPGQ
jgi:hypothetical protein